MKHYYYNLSKNLEEKPGLKFNRLFKVVSFLGFILILLPFIFTTTYSMGNNPKEEQYKILNQNLKITQKEFLESPEELKAEKAQLLKTASEVRKQNLMADLNSDPETFLKNAKLGNERNNYPEGIRENIEENIEIEGEFNTVIIDEDGKSSKEYTIEANDRIYKLRTWKELEVASGSKVRIKGVRLDTQIAFAPDSEYETGIQVLTLAAQATVTDARIAIILFKFSNTTSEPFSVQDVNNAFINDASSVRNYYIENSLNNLSISATTFGWYQINMTNNTCDYTSFTNAVNNVMANQGVNLSSYNYKFYVFPRTQGCPGSGWAQQSGNIAWSNGYNDSRLYSHELGHNFNASHANSYDCGARAIDIASNCTATEYGDTYDVMGNFWYMQSPTHFNTGHKLATGWISSSKIAEINSDGIYTVYSMERAQQGLQGLKIRKIDSGQYYYISKKENYGFDTQIPTSITNGAMIHIWNENSYSPTYLIDTTPNSFSDQTQDFSDATLSGGRTFYDPINKFRVKHISNTSNSVTVEVDFENDITPTPTTTPTPTPKPTITPTPTTTPTPTPKPTATPTPTPNPSIEIIKNGGFELDNNSDGSPDNWTKNSKFKVNKYNVYEGKYSGRHYATNNASYSINQYPKDIVGGASYVFSGWVLIPKNNDGYFNFKINIRWRDKNNNIISTDNIGSFKSSTVSWVKIGKTVKAPSYATNAIINMKVNSLNGKIFVDAFSLKSL